jgi:Zn-dependent peptidase ImmA (M78 family)/DNA-binding XRE family transcriptional regulator
MIGARVKLAREACRFTQQQLAGLAGVSQGALSAIESGRVGSPSEETVARIAAATQFPSSFFYLGPLPDLPEGNYRRLQRGTSKIDKQIKAQVLHIVEVVARSESRLKLPPVTLTPLQEVASLDGLESIAEETRGLLGFNNADPIRNLTRAAERRGVVVVRLPSEAKDHDSFSAWPDFGLGGRPIIALAAGHPGDRDRFNVAHELAHLILHTVRPGVDSRRAEQEANRLGGAILLPKRAAAAEMNSGPVTLRVLMEVKAKYGVSMAAAARRAYDLSLISAAQFESIHKQLSARRWRREEPVEVPIEKPLMIAQVVDALGGRGSLMQRAERISMSRFTLRALEET